MTYRSDLDELTAAAEAVIEIALHPNRPTVLKDRDIGKVSRLRRAIGAMAISAIPPRHTPAPWASRTRSGGPESVPKREVQSV